MNHNREKRFIATKPLGYLALAGLWILIALILHLLGIIDLSEAMK